MQMFTVPTPSSPPETTSPGTSGPTPGNHFFGCAHTQANFEEAFYHSNIADYAAYEQWSAEGRLTAEQRANRVWKQMLAEYNDPGINPAIDEALREFCDRRKASLTDEVIEE